MATWHPPRRDLKRHNFLGFRPKNSIQKSSYLTRRWYLDLADEDFKGPFARHQPNLGWLGIWSMVCGTTARRSPCATETGGLDRVLVPGEPKNQREMNLLSRLWFSFELNHPNFATKNRL